MFSDGRYKGKNNPMYGVSRFGCSNPNSKSVINVNTNEVYKTVKEASLKNNIPYTILISKLKGKRGGIDYLKYYEDKSK